MEDMDDLFGHSTSARNALRFAHMRQARLEKLKAIPIDKMDRRSILSAAANALDCKYKTSEALFKMLVEAQTARVEQAWTDYLTAYRKERE
jgi:hypothetical protein